MRVGTFMLAILVLSGSLLCGGCGGGSSSTPTPPPPTQTTAAAAPTIGTTDAQNGALLVTLADTTPSATIYYTLDGSKPTTKSQVYQAPFLVASNLTVGAVASAAGYTESSAVTKAFTLSIPAGTLVWSDEFNSTGATPGQANSNVWAYDTGFQCCGNHEQETYCAWGSTTSPCDGANPNSYIGSDNLLHVVARTPSKGVYTSGRLKTQGKFSFLYGRVEARMKLPESQGMWPAFWALGNNIATISWPACGELDIMEHIDGATPPLSAGGQPLGYDWVAGSVHGGASGSNELNGTERHHPAAFSAADWHTYGMIWRKGEVQFYVDDPGNVYATFKSTDATWANNMWPFDDGPQFLIFNLAVGGDWPGNVDSSTVLPSDMQVDYVRIYTN